MNTIIYITLIALAAALLISTLKNIKLSKNKNQEEKEPESTPQEMPYEKKMLLTKTEYSFYKTLKSKCDEANLLICPKVRLEDIANVTSKENVQKWRGYIKSRHVDFIICDANLKVIAALELDDYSHNDKRAQKTDEFKNNLFVKIGIPLFRIKTNSKYEEEIDKMIAAIKS